MELTMQREKEMLEVQWEVNEETTYRTDADLYHKAELWVVADGEGDCEDYALAKRQRLLRLGWSLEALRLCTCWTEEGDYHAVLTVECDKGTYVLDNRHPYPVMWHLLPYRWHRRQQPGRCKWVLVPDTKEA